MKTFHQVAFCMLFPVAVVFGAGGCPALIPQGGAYDVLRTTDNSTFQQVIEEYTYEKDFSSHDEAIKAGLSVGAIVHGVPLKVGGTFTNQQRSEWRREYESRRKISTQSAVYKAFKKLTLNVEVIEDIFQRGLTM